MNKWRISGILFILVAGVLCAQWQWPLTEMELVKNFTPFQPYLLIAAPPAAEVFPIADGALFLRQHNSALISDLQSAGPLLVIRHGDGLLSVYGNLQLFDTPISIDKPLGNIEDTLMLAIIDEETQSWVNPEIILPLRLEGNAPIDSGKWYQLIGQTIRQVGSTIIGDFPIFVGRSSLNSQIAPHQYEITINDAAPLFYRFDNADLNSPREYDARLWFSLPELPFQEGDNQVRITAWDLLGQKYRQNLLIYYQAN